MELLYALLLGIVQGATEFIPVSSTGHLVLTQTLLGIPANTFWELFIIFIQLGTLIAATAISFPLLKEKRMQYATLLGFIPTALIGVVAYSLISEGLRNPHIVLWALGIGGVLMLLIEKYSTEHAKPLTLIRAFGIGIIQTLAFIPGVSRSGATIIGGRLLGLDRSTIVRFSFLLSIPTIAGAAGMQLLHTPLVFTTHEWTVLAVGTIVAAISGYAVMRFFIRYISTHSFAVFGWYRIGIALLLSLVL